MSDADLTVLPRPDDPRGAAVAAHQPVVGAVDAFSAVEQDVVVREVSAPALGVVSLVLARSDGDPLPPWTPGAHIDLLLEPGLERQYSLCGDPSDLTSYRIAVLEEPDGRGGSAFVHHRIRPGATLRIRGPRNLFPLVPATEYLLIAGGIGVTPLVPMAAELERTGRRWTMIYGGRGADSMAFLDELAAYGDTVTVWPQDTHGLIDLASLLGTVRPGMLVYCCGPETLIDAVEATCAHWPPGTVHVERFRPRAGALSGPDSEFEVELAYSELTVRVLAGQSIVDAIEAVGVEVLTSCREGTCGTCETPVLAGVPDHRDSLLTAEERAANTTMMICCGRSRTPRLVLDL
jgi:ferredoxin-NADP reductase